MEPTEVQRDLLPSVSGQPPSTQQPMGTVTRIATPLENGDEGHEARQDKNGTERIIEESPNRRYAKLNHILGKGAYKVVYKAIDREEGYEVAWNTCQTTKAEFMALNEEIEILKRVRHPNIIQFHDCWFSNMEFVFITELMTSGTLREYIKKLQVPNLKIVKRWARQILKGLSYLHSHDPPIIHRDIKCDNIFINGAHGEVKIGDMGTAKMKLGKKYTVIGTPEFMAPEMYEERGYNEKVDIYAFGMALLEMVTGEYPYSECKNAAQIYKKVTQGLKPECLTRVQDPDVLDLISNCIDQEDQRLSAQQIVDHSFLTVEPEVILIPGEDKTCLAMQVVFKGMDKLSVKFEFNIDTDTAENVVHEMILEQVLPSKYQHLITAEINRIIREKSRLAMEQDTNREESRQPRPSWTSPEGVAGGAATPPVPAPAPAPMPAVVASGATSATTPGSMVAEIALEASTGLGPRRTTSSRDASPPVFSRKESLSEKDEASMEYSYVAVKDFADGQAVEELVQETALATGRGMEKAREWLSRLHAQDILTVGDLRDLHDEDWSNIGLTVFASRALKNALYGKRIRKEPSSTFSSVGSLKQT